MEIIIKGQPIPAKRVTKRTLWKAKEYSDYKDYVALSLLRLKIPQMLGDITIKRISFFRKDHRRPDIDNLLKAILDSMQLAQVFKNDRQVTKIKELSVEHGCDDPRVEIEL